jgi:oxygen-independent coproporphyrinogen-3 oxidase
MIEAGIYIHFPFCVKKCPYCDFNSYAVAEDSKMKEKYGEALRREILSFPGKRAEEMSIVSVYFGGGTPTLFSPAELNDILALLRERFVMVNETEVTVETNPKLLSLDDYAVLRQGGFNRLSLGIQSFQDRILKRLERIHTREDCLSSIERAREAGFSNINFDLMFGIPGQSLRDWVGSLDESFLHEPEHMAAYNLTIEKHTPFHQRLEEGLLELPDEEIQLAMYEKTLELLQEKGFEHYEISNFARSGFASVHNQIYWRNECYLGFGAGAYSYLDGTRYRSKEYPEDYIRDIETKGRSCEEKEKLAPEEQMDETVIMGLRLIKGIDMKRFEERFKTGFMQRYDEEISRLLQEGMIVLENGRLRLSRRGLLFSNRVMMEFLKSHEC